MKRIKRFASLLLAMVMVLAMGITVFAANTAETVGSEKGGPGSITITNANPGQTYGFWRIFSATPDEDGAHVSYKLIKAVLEDDKEFYTYFSVDSAGNVSIKDAGKDGSNLSAAAVAYLNKNYNKLGEFVYDAVTTDEGLAEGTTRYDLTVTGLPYGYYYITTTTGTVVSVDTVQPNAETEDKNPGTSIDKKVTGVGTGSLDENGKNALAQVGTTVNYESRIPIANGAKNYVFTDTMSDGLTLDTSSVKVYLVTTGSDVTEDVTEETEYGDLTAENKTGDSADITIEFDDTWLTNNTGKDIVIQYSATLNGNAVISGTDGNPNTATISWGNTSDYLHDEDEAKVFSAKIDVTKTNGSDPLGGAGFVLKNSEGKFYKNESGIVSWVDAETDATEYTTEVKDGTAVVTFSGLANGTYTLVEKTVPAGYNKAADEEITIIDKNVTVDNTTKPVTVINQTGTELPSTGGIGTTIFYVVGGILVVAAGILLVTKKRMSAR